MNPWLQGVVDNAVANAPDGLPIGRMALCSDCAVKADFAMQTGQGVHIPQKFTCEGCNQDVLFVVHTPRTPERLLLLNARLAVEAVENDEQNSKT